MDGRRSLGCRLRIQRQRQRHSYRFSRLTPSAKNKLLAPGKNKTLDGKHPKNRAQIPGAKSGRIMRGPNIGSTHYVSRFRARNLGTVFGPPWEQQSARMLAWMAAAEGRDQRPRPKAAARGRGPGPRPKAAAESHGPRPRPRAAAQGRGQPSSLRQHQALITIRLTASCSAFWPAFFGSRDRCSEASFE